MADGFEAWARAEVVRLRREADLLEAALARYDASGGVPAANPSGVRRNAPLMRALLDAGIDGLTLDEVVAAAGRAGLGERRATVRSFLWNHVRAGRLVLSGDRYVTAVRDAEGVLPRVGASAGDAVSPERDDTGRDGGETPP